jgi:hypothetical protein
MRVSQKAKKVRETEKNLRILQREKEPWKIRRLSNEIDDFFLLDTQKRKPFLFNSEKTYFHLIISFSHPVQTTSAIVLGCLIQSPPYLH